MSDENKPKPVRKTSAVELRKTSAVPLRKETVRVTLKATPQDSKPPNAPPAPPTPLAPPAPAPTIPLKTAGAASPQPPAPAPTIPLKTAGAASPQPPAPAPTVKLGTPVTPAPATPGASSQPLPKATVQLQDTQSMGAPTVATPAGGPTIVTAPGGEVADGKEEGSAAALSIISLVAALIVLGVQLATANIWVNDETQTNPGWGKLFE